VEGGDHSLALGIYRELEHEASILAGIRETEELGAAKAIRAKELRKAAKDLISQLG
jgi:hypothetical protein